MSSPCFSISFGLSVNLILVWRVVSWLHELKHMINNLAFGLRCLPILFRLTGPLLQKVV